MSAIKDRFLYGTLLLAAVLGILWADLAFDSTMGFLLLSVLFATVSWIEFRRMSGAAVKTFTVFGALAIIAVLIAEWAFANDRLPSEHYTTFLLAIAGTTPLGCLLLSLRAEPTRERAIEIAVASLGVVYFAVPFLLFLKLRQQPQGEWWVVLTVLVVKANDIGGYLAGRQFGRTKLSRLSPNKTVEGAVGGLLLGVVAALGVYAAWLVGEATLPWEKLIVLGIVVGAAGQTGDLVESLFKRAFGVKDSGALVPAFGGTLDMIDSILFGAPMVYFCRNLLEL